MRRILPLLIAAAFTGCISLASGAERVRFTRIRADVAGCEMLGNVEGLSRGALICAEPCQIELRNRTAALGGDTVFFTGSGTGMAYRCRR